MFAIILFAGMLILIIMLMVVFIWKAVQRRSATPVAVSASAPHAASVVLLALLGILTALGFQWARERRRRLAINHRR